MGDLTFSGLTRPQLSLARWGRLLLANLQHQGTIAALHEQKQDAIFSCDFA